MVWVAAILLATALASPDAQLRGTVVDAVTQRPVASVVVTDGMSVALTNERGEFSLRVGRGEIEISIQRLGYHSLSAKLSSDRIEPSNLFIRLRPDLLSGDPIEVTYEALKPQMLRQDKFAVPARFQLMYAGQVFRGLYRFCIHADGRVAAVIPLRPAGAADELVQQGILTGWQYKQLPQPACFLWNVELQLATWRDEQRRRDLLPGDR